MSDIIETKTALPQKVLIDSNENKPVESARSDEDAEKAFADQCLKDLISATEKNLEDEGLRNVITESSLFQGAGRSPTNECFENVFAGVQNPGVFNEISKNDEVSVCLEFSSEINVAEETSSPEEIDSLGKDEPREEIDELQNADIVAELTTEVVSDVQNPEIINESPKNDEVLDELAKSAEKDSNANASAEEDVHKKSPEEEKDTLEKSSTEEAHERSSPYEKNLASENITEDNSQTSESNTSESIVKETDITEENSQTSESNISESVVKETALGTDDSNSGDAETEKMEIDARTLSPESPVENDTEMAENVEENLLNKEIEENSLNKEIEENPLNKEMDEKKLHEETEENLLSKEVEENTLNKEVEENSINEGMEVDEFPLQTEVLEVNQDDASNESSACAKESEMEVDEDILTKVSEHSEKNDITPDNISTKDIQRKEEECKFDDGSSAIDEEKVLFIPIELDEDADIEEYEDFTAQEIMEYLEKKINDYMENPEINDLLRVQIESNQLREQVQAKTEEINRLQTILERLYNDQEKMLRYYGILPKPPTRDVQVYVDLPALELHPKVNNNAKELIQKKEVTITPCGTAPKNNVAAPNVQTGTSVLKKTASPPKKESPVECIDLTDDVDAPSSKVQAAKNTSNIKTYSMNNPVQTKQPNSLHPAPLPIMPTRVNRFLNEAPPKPRVKISCDDKGIILQWDADLNDRHEKLQCFEIFGYQEQNNQNVTSALWKRIGNVKTLSLPMACTLTKFVPGNNYHFTVRGLDIHNRPGTFSDPVSTRFEPSSKAP